MSDPTDTAWTATPHLQWLRTDTDIKLQQLWQAADGRAEWRDIPVADGRSDERKARDEVYARLKYGIE